MHLHYIISICAFLPSNPLKQIDKNKKQNKNKKQQQQNGNQHARPKNREKSKEYFEESFILHSKRRWWACILSNSRKRGQQSDNKNSRLNLLPVKGNCTVKSSEG